MAIPLWLDSSFRPRAARFTFLLLGLATVGQAQFRLPNRLEGAFHGEAAITKLGAQLPAVAQGHGLQPAELTTLFRIQRGLGVDADGALLFVCEAPTVQPSSINQADTTTSTALSGAVTSTAGDPFKLHSFPGASRVI